MPKTGGSRTKASSRRFAANRTIAVALAPVASATLAAPPITPEEPLATTVARLDTQLFDAFNACDLETFGSMLADDLEFDHDHDGLSRGDRRRSTPRARTSAAS